MGGAGAADPANTRSLNYGANENKAVGANVFNGNNANETPEFIRITAIRGKNGTNGLMTLENGEDITVGQVISRADFERIFWNASKSDGSFSFVPVQDAKGTVAPNTVEQTVVIKTPETPAPSSNPGTSSGEGGNTGHEAGSQTGAASGSGAGSSTGSGTGSSTGTGANTGANAGTGTANNGTDPNNTTGQQSGNNQGDSSAQNTGSPSGTGETSNQGASSGDGTTPAGGKPGAEGSGSENKPSTGSGADSTSGSASGSGSTSGSDLNNGSGSDKGGSTPSEGQSSQASNGQAPSQNAGGQGSESQPPAQTPSGQGGSEQTTAPTQGSPSGEQTPAQNASGQGDASQTPPQNSGGGSDTGNPATGNPGTGDTAQTGGTQPDGAKGEDGEQGKNGEDTVSPSNPPATTPPPTPPDYAPNQSVQQAIHANNKPVGASIFNGTNPAHAPSFVKITAVLDKDGEEVPDAMTLGKEGEAITTDQVISKEQFESVFLDALKAPGGSFKFIPVMDSEGTEMPGATEQTVSIGFNYVHHFQSEPFREGYEGEDRFSYYRIYSLTEHQDTNGTLDGMFKLDGGERTTLKLGDMIRPEDFDKLYWDYSSNNGGRFTLVGVDASGKDLTDEKNQNLVLEEVAKTRTGRLPPDEPGGEETDDEDGDDIEGHSATLHPESFTDAASAFHGSSHFSVNGQSTLDNLLDQQMNHGLI